MAETNKIISFADALKRKKAEYKLKAEISLYMSRNNETYTINWSSPNNILEEDIYSILKSILEDLSTKVEEIHINKIDTYEVTITFFYYKKDDGSNDFRYIYTPRNIKEEKLTEYLYTSIQIYELKKAGGLN